LGCWYIALTMLEYGELKVSSYKILVNMYDCPNALGSRRLG